MGHILWHGITIDICLCFMQDVDARNQGYGADNTRYNTELTEGLYINEDRYKMHYFV